MKAKIFLDLDGTVYLDGLPFPDVLETLHKLSTAGSTIHYITNNTSESVEQYSKKLANIGLPVFEGAVISPISILLNWMKNNKKRKVYPIGTKSFEYALVNSGIATVDHCNPDLVIVAFDKELTYEKLMISCKLINSGVPWYITHIDLACPSIHGPMPDCGSIGAMIEKTTGVPPSGHFGKPGKHLVRYLQSIIHDDERIVVAGDRLYTDAALGLKIGAHTILVKTGEFKAAEEDLDPRIEVHETLVSALSSYFEI